jgi:hypothetical protein
MPARHTQGPGNHGFLKGGNCPNEYRIWAGILQRCYNPRCREYHYYGDRGITVCDRWREANGFANFFADVGPQPFRRASLHRIDNDGPYEPGNVAWADAKTQMRNMCGNRILTYNGRSQILVEWAEELGIKPVTLAQRLHKGWPPEKALTQPVEHRRPYAEWVRRNPNPRMPGPKPRLGDEDACPTPGACQTS